MISTLLLLPLLSLQVPAIDAQQLLAIPPRQQRLLTDQEEDGTVWARGENYKLRVGVQGLSFIPRERHARTSRSLDLGPVELSVGGDSIALPQALRPCLDERRVTLDRGILSEVLDLSPEGVKQSFVIHELPRTAGDLVLRIPTAGEVYFESDGESGLRFRSPEGGEVRYGDVLTFDADGARMTNSSRMQSGKIELHVPAAFLASARFPLTIDPFLSQFAVDLGSDDPLNGDCAADDSTNIVLCVMEDTFSSGDRDIISRRFDQNGGFLDEVAVDISNDDTVTPAVANYEMINQFLVVWLNTGSGILNPRRIEGRTRAATSTTQGNEKNFSIAQGDESAPDVGGPRTGTTAQYYVVWSERSTFKGMNLRGRGMRADGSLATIDIFDFPGDQTNPVINKTTTETGRYLLIYQEPEASGAVSLRAFSMLANGSPEGTFGPISSPGVSSYEVAGEQERFLVVYQKANSGTESDILVSRITYESGEIGVGEKNLSALEPSVIASRHQFNPSVAVTANGFVYAYAEAPSAQDFNSNIFAAALGPDVVNLTFLEGHVALLPAGIGADTRVRLASFPLGLRTFPVWNYVDAAGDSDVRGAIYETP